MTGIYYKTKQGKRYFIASGSAFVTRDIKKAFKFKDFKEANNYLKLHLAGDLRYFIFDFG